MSKVLAKIDQWRLESDTDQIVLFTTGQLPKTEDIHTSIGLSISYRSQMAGQAGKKKMAISFSSHLFHGR